MSRVGVAFVPSSNLPTVRGAGYAVGNNTQHSSSCSPPARGCLPRALPAPWRSMAWIPEYVHLLRAKDEIDRRYAEPLDVATLALTALASEGHFARSFKRAFGESPY